MIQGLFPNGALDPDGKKISIQINDIEDEKKEAMKYWSTR
mgnify:CR=1 FL=1